MRVGLLPAGIAVALSPAFAMAQESGKDATTLDSLVVTGSRIRSTDVETQQPVISLTRAEIQKQGFTSIADIVQNISAAGTPAISRADALSSGEETGGQYVDLRNLGPERTLVLIDGKRMGITSAGYSDLASIPTSIVERVEVLTDGASAIYGSDAIAGVINIITRKNFDGAEASAYLGQYDQGDGSKQVYNFLIGSSGERSAVALGVEYSKEDPVLAKDREFSAHPMGPSHPVPDIYNGRIRANGWSATTQKGRMIDGDGTSWTVNPNGDPTNFADFHVTDPLHDYANTNQQMFLQTGLERRSLFANGRFDVNDSVAFKADALYTHRETLQQIAGYPYQSSVYGTPLSADSYFNPIDEDVDFLRRTWEVPRQTRSELTTYRFTGGFEGSFEIADKPWDWDIGYLYNQNKGVKTGTGNLFLPNVENAVGPSFRGRDGAIHCGSPGAEIEGCVPWNPLAAYGMNAPGSLTSDGALRAYLFPTSHGTSDTETTVYSANISGVLAELPAGDLSMATGVEHRREQALFEPDAMDQSGLTTDLAGSTTSGGYSLDEVYLEFLIPVLADLPGAKELTFNVAGRYSDYSTFGDTVNSKFGLKWKPVDDLLVRGTYATGFRAPTVSDLYGGTTETFDNLTDPCDSSFGAASRNPSVAARCAADGIPSTFRQEASGGVAATGPGTQTNYTYLSGSNPNLTPETSKSYTFGLVWSPSFAEGLNVSLDWWKIHIDNVIASETVTSILNQCYLLGIEASCDRFERAGGGNRNVLKRYQVIDATRTLINGGYQETAGYDFALSYKLPETSFGQFKIDWKSTYVDYLEYKRDNEDVTPVQQYNGWADSEGVNYRVRSNLGMGWTLGDWSANWNMRYYSGAKEACAYDESCDNPGFVSSYTQAQAVRNFGSNTFHDMQVSYHTPWNATVAIGANNVFDHEGPIMYSKPDSSFVYNGGFDIGRFWYLKYQQSF
ncbi:TonB-dependent receptor [Lysobacter sp. MMG2]|nr:TonB-dependent receptor [Lysobacter sp. MMG2]